MKLGRHEMGSGPRPGPGSRTLRERVVGGPDERGRGVHGPDFMSFWAGQTIGMFGMRLGMIAMPVVAVQVLNASESQVGILNAAITAAFLFLGLPAGAWVDRWLKRPTLVIANAVRAAAAMSIPVLYLIGNLQIWHLYVVALVTGLATVFFDVAYQSYVPLLVPVQQIGGANSRLEATSQVAMTAGPAIGGLLLKVMSAPLLLVGNALGYLISFLLIMRTRDDEAANRQPATGAGLFADVREGLIFSWREPVIRAIIGGNLLSATGGTIWLTLFPVLVLRRLGMDGTTYGLILTVGAAGGLLGALLAGWARRTWGDALAIPGSLLFHCLANLAVPLAAYLSGAGAAVALMAGLFVAGIGSLIYNILQVSLRQRLTPRHLLGRMNASIRWVVWGAMPLASLAAGWLGETIGLVPTLWIGTLFSLTAIVPLWHIGRGIPAPGSSPRRPGAPAPPRPLSEPPLLDSQPVPD